MSDNIHYKDLIVKATFENDEEGNVVLNTQFTRYSEEVWCNGQNVTYSYSQNQSLVGLDCIIFTSCICEHPVAKSEETKAFSDPKKMGTTKESVKTEPEFIKNYSEPVIVKESIEVIKL